MIGALICHVIRNWFVVGGVWVTWFRQYRGRPPVYVVYARLGKQTLNLIGILFGHVIHRDLMIDGIWVR